MKSLSVRLIVLFIVAMTLTILPIPTLFYGIRPLWVVLLVLYVQFFLPHYFRLTWLFVLGLSLDVLLSSALGEHVLALILTSWLATGKARRFNFFSIIQQMLLVALLCLIYQVILFIIDWSQGYNQGIWFLISAPIISFLGWPWIRLLADRVFLVRRTSRQI